MEQLVILERLKKLDVNKLIDVVKNYKQYGYSDDVRNYALNILEERGISKQDLQLTGNLENNRYESAKDVLASFKKNSKIAFTFYTVIFLLKIIAPHLNITSGFIDIILAIILVLSVIIYFVFLFKSFLAQSDFYKITGEEFGSDGALIYLFLGMPFYIFMYFVFRNQMNERMKSFK